MRRFALDEIERRTFDVAIIGGGVTGAAAAREAALRGLSVALVEKGDFASGTSSRSTKLLHGGLRYLESHEFKLVREACHERELMLKLAPHLANVRPFIYVLYDGYPESMRLLSAGLSIYDVFSGNPLKRRHRMLPAAALLELETHLNRAGLVGGGLYYDFLTDDARFTIDTLKGAADAGALAANYVEVTGLLEENGKITGVSVIDHINSETGVVRARQVINTAGPWVDTIRFLEDGVGERLLRPTKGVHIVVRKDDFPLEHAVFVRSPRDNRVVWPIPALDEELVYIGTTDTDYDGALDHVTASDDDIDYLLEVANFTIPDAALDRTQIVATWAGLRPLIQPEGSMAASSVSREQQIITSPRGLLTIAGGKLTTSRVMGRQVIDAAIELLGTNFGLRGVPRSRSASVPISGGDPGEMFLAHTRLGELAIEQGVRNRWRVYGGNGRTLADIAQADPEAARDLGVKHLTLAEVRYAIQEEMALTITDFFARRASVFYWAEDGGLSVADVVADEMARLLGWSVEQRGEQLTAYREWVAANRFVPVPA
jgi:glycerol-3-phosphate dehydrogenase